MNSKTFFAELDARIAKHDLLCHPFYRAWSAGQLTRQDLGEYALDYFPHVEAFPRYLDEFASRLEEGSLRHAVLMNRDDEMGDGAGPAHAELWMDFAEGMGKQRSGERAPLAAMQTLVDSFHAVALAGLPEEALAAFYAYESQVPRVAREKARGLRDWYGADEKTRAYFTLHTTADLYHSGVWRQQLAKLVENDNGAAERALQAGENAAKALWNALDGIEASRLERASQA